MIAAPQNICSEIQNSLVDAGLFSTDRKKEAHHWRIAPEPFLLAPEQVRFFEDLGGHLLKFYTALNQLYLDSVKGKAPEWVAEYLDAGKPDSLTDLGRMKRFKSQLPGIIRPDVIATQDGFTVTELDSVPGGFGVTSRLMDLYTGRGWDVVGQDDGGMLEKFYRMMETTAETPEPVVAIVVSDEAQDYLNEMQDLGRRLRDAGHPVHVVHPRDVIFQEEGLYLKEGDTLLPLDAIYRFYELFDLKNIPKSELLMYSQKKRRVRTTPPYKAWLEEKLSFALFHHPGLTSSWEKMLGAETFEHLSHLIPNTWVLDSRPLPPQAVVPGLTVQEHAVRNWSELLPLKQKERELVIKPSGFSPEAWGSRGVVMGHDVSSEDWQGALNRGLDAFPEQPHILQEFHKGKRFPVTYWNPSADSMATMEARVRLTPYYFVIKNEARLGGILATLCPQDKKKIHGMVDAVLVPCAQKPECSL